jgi:uncharacterized protein YndB with AHSA1/START domain
VHRNEHTVEIARPAAEVFSHLASGDKRVRWMGALKTSEQVTDGEPRLGTRFRDVFEEQGHRFDIDSEIVDWQPNARLATRLRSSSFEATATQELAELDGRTRLTTTIETEYRSAMARLMAGVVTRHAQRQLEQDLARLKQIVENAAS